MAAVLRVGLGKHHQLDIDRVATQRLKVLHQVIDFVIGQGQPQLAVGSDQRFAASANHIDTGLRRGLGVIKQATGGFKAGEDRLHHAIVQQGRNHLPRASVKLTLHVVAYAPL